MHSLGNNMEYISTFCEGMLAFQNQGVLSCALLPMNISGEVRSLMHTKRTHDQSVQTKVMLAQDVSETGDSLIRLLLNISAIQTPLAAFLLKQLPILQNAMEVDSTDALPQLVLGSLRWCDADLSFEPHPPSQHQH